MWVQAFQVHITRCDGQGSPENELLFLITATPEFSALPLFLYISPFIHAVRVLLPPSTTRIPFIID